MERVATYQRLAAVLRPTMTKQADGQGFDAAVASLSQATQDRIAAVRAFLANPSPAPSVSPLPSASPPPAARVSPLPSASPPAP